MEITEEEQNLKIELHNTNNILPSNSNTPISPKNNQNEENTSNNQLKIGQFNLTPLECLILNKKMPHGFKFEIEENIKSLEQNKHHQKKVKGAGGHGDHQKHVKIIKNQKIENKNNNLNKEHSTNNNKKQKKVSQKENSSNINTKVIKGVPKNQGGASIIQKNENNINNNSESYKIMMKCYSGFNQIKSNPSSKYFYLSKFPNSPSLSNIEKKIKNYEYKTVNDFYDDLRKLWNYQFKNHAKEPNIYQNICKMSLLSDQICKELSNENVNENKNEEISNIKKRTEKQKKDLDEIKINNYNDGHSKIYRHKNMEEIYHLGNLIRSLTKPQLRGIITVLSDNNENLNCKSFEFDLEQLPPEKFKKLKDYVLSCYNKDAEKKYNFTVNRNGNSVIGLDKEIYQAENKIKNNNNDLQPIDKCNINNKINNVNNVGINKECNSNIKEENISNQLPKNKEEKKELSDKKSFSDSLSSDSSLSN